MVKYGHTERGRGHRRVTKEVWHVVLMGKTSNVVKPLKKNINALNLIAYHKK